ncbi:MAG: ribonuclease HI [Sulfurihydrogenibium sp.]|uniref:ribonuclease HI n=1 Tax=Sulfurihydrogenibium sp. TaxID=2053621 RepID=UPI003C7BD124
MKKVKIFADGSCLGNPGPGGYAAIITDDKKKFIIKGGEKNTTNNRMELTAVIKALETLDKGNYEIDLYTDSSYVVNGLTSWLDKWIKNGWKTSSGKPVENKDLWERLYKQVIRHKINPFWIKGHSGHPENEYCDKTAKLEALKIKNEKK